jgi:hypothetical protein
MTGAGVPGPTLFHIKWPTKHIGYKSEEKRGRSHALKLYSPFFTQRYEGTQCVFVGSKA